MASKTRMDHRAEMLADLIRRRVDVLALAMRPPGSQTPFTEQLSNNDALVFWRKHRYDPLGQKVIARLTPAQVMELDTWLAAHPDPTLDHESIEL